MTRLNLASLARTNRRLPIDPGTLTTGIVHLGLGAFARAHTVPITEEAMVATGETRWGVTAITGRSGSVADGLRPQDFLYTVAERDQRQGAARVVGAIREALVTPDDSAAIVRAIADPSVSIVTMTITEKGYHTDPLTGGLDLADHEIRADLGGLAPVTAIGQIVRGLELRHREGRPPLTVVSCDNLPQNGRLIRRHALEFAEAMSSSTPGLVAWIRDDVAFPSTMVDRMVPATTETLLDEVEAELGLRDEAAVMAETFRQWVIEDVFAGPRPAWERAGALFVDDIAPWEEAKLRLLNASHSLLAYLGLLGGHDTIAETISDEANRRAARGLMADDAIPTITIPAELDASAYSESILRRFSNAALRHSTAKVAADGSLKLPLRILPTIRARRAAGFMPRWAALAVAAWMRHIAQGAPLDDPAAELLRAVLPAGGSHRAVVEALLGVESVFGRDLAHDQPFVDTLVRWFELFDTPDLLRKEMLQ